jgi:acyl carrier protein
MTAMSSEQILQRLNEVFQDVFDDDDLAIKPEYSAEDVDGWDSLTHIRMLLTVEKTFGVKFSTSEVGQLQTVGDLVKLIASKSRA